MRARLLPLPPRRPAGRRRDAKRCDPSPLSTARGRAGRQGESGGLGVSTRARDMRSPCLHLLASLAAVAVAVAGGHARINRLIVVLSAQRCAPAQTALAVRAGASKAPPPPPSEPLHHSSVAVFERRSQSSCATARVSCGQWAATQLASSTAPSRRHNVHCDCTAGPSKLVPLRAA